MPRWDFKCPRCGWVEEASYSDTDSAELAIRYCPVCRSSDDTYAGLVKLVRQFPSGSVRFKGPGFYATDYKSKETK